MFHTLTGPKSAFLVKSEWGLTSNLFFFFSHWDNLNRQRKHRQHPKKSAHLCDSFIPFNPLRKFISSTFLKKTTHIFFGWGGGGYFSTFPLHSKMVQTALFDITQSALQHTTTENTGGTDSDCRYAAIWHSNRGWKQTLEGRKHYFHVRARAQRRGWGSFFGRIIRTMWMRLFPHFVWEEVLVTFTFPEDLLAARGRRATVSSEHFLSPYASWCM